MVLIGVDWSVNGGTYCFEAVRGGGGDSVCVGFADRRLYGCSGGVSIDFKMSGCRCL